MNHPLTISQAFISQGQSHILPLCTARTQLISHDTTQPASAPRLGELGTSPGDANGSHCRWVVSAVDVELL